MSKVLGIFRREDVDLNYPPSLDVSSNAGFDVAGEHSNNNIVIEIGHSVLESDVENQQDGTASLCRRQSYQR